MKIYFLIAIASLLFLGTLHSQPGISKIDTGYTSVNKVRREESRSTRLKWTRQLPAEVRNSFFTSPFANWFIEKMVQSNCSDGKTVYRFYLDNGNLLDADHHDSFLKTDSLDIASDGTILSISACRPN